MIGPERLVPKRQEIKTSAPHMEMAIHLFWCGFFQFDILRPLRQRPGGPGGDGCQRDQQVLCG